MEEFRSPLFDRSRLLKLIIPLMIEHLLSVTVGIADTVMVSSAGESAVSGISLVNQICTLLNVMFQALSTGGSVVAAQYVGKGSKEDSCRAANQLVLSCLSVALVLTAFALCTNKWLIRTIYGSIEQDVMDCGVIYLYITACSFPFLALYNGGAALFRAMGNSRISMVASFIMNGINIIGNAILIYGFKMGVAGAAYSTLASRVVAAVIVMILLRNPKLPLHVSRIFKNGFDIPMIRKILKIGVPSALENSMFQFGKLLTSSLISSFGTASIAANACVNNFETLSHIPASAIGTALVTIVGQCVGAGQYKQARGYTKKLLKYSYYFLIGLNVIMFFFAKQIAGIYNLSEEGFRIAVILLRFYNAMSVFIWPLAFTLPSLLRAAGDATFPMYISVGSMWIFRVVLAYILGGWMQKEFGLGVWGVWIAMSVDWACRAICFTTRFAGHKWENKSLVKD